MKILVVDDFSVTRKQIANTLKELGFSQTLEANDGYEALASLKSFIIDFVVVEWEMKDMSGLELLKEIRRDNNFKNIPVLMVTDNGSEENVIDATKAGVNNYIIKPINKIVLSEKLNQIFSGIK